jgi:hypothetical protein
MMASPVRSALLFAAGLLLLGNGQKPTGSMPEAERVWRRHEAVVDGALRGHKYFEDERSAGSRTLARLVRENRHRLYLDRKTGQVRLTVGLGR